MPSWGECVALFVDFVEVVQVVVYGGVMLLQIVGEKTTKVCRRAYIYYFGFGVIVQLEFLEGEYSSACEGLVFKGGGCYDVEGGEFVEEFCGVGFPQGINHNNFIIKGFIDLKPQGS